MIHVEQVGGNQLDRANKLLSGIGDGTGLRNAIYNALKRSGDSARTKAGQFAASEYTITKGTFMSKTKTNYHIHYGGGKLSGGLVSVEISFAGGVIPLLEFNTRYSRHGGMQTQVKRSGGAEALKHVFAASIYGKIAAFERVGAPRFPVEGKFGPSTAHMMQEEGVVQKMDDTIRETFDSRIDHEIMRALNGW